VGLNKCSLTYDTKGSRRTAKPPGAWPEYFGRKMKRGKVEREDEEKEM